ncbi:MAG: DUF4342 domain-containing protein [Bacillota bacterium]
MEISLEKIDAVRERTGVTYKEAKEALEATEGNVVDAIIHIEERQNVNWKDNISEAGNEVLEKLKTIVKKGNVTKIVLKKDNDVIMNIPVTAGAIGAVLSPPIAMVGVLSALATKCRIEIVKTDGEVVDLNEMAEDTLKNVKSKMEEVRDKVAKEACDKKEVNFEKKETEEDKEE